jgi:predicted ATPase/DNA-binding winged helix-turn-helix (wHTH) protein
LQTCLSLRNHQLLPNLKEGNGALGRVGAGGMKEFASFRLDTANECLWREGVQIALPPRPYKVLRYLVENPGRLITHDELLDALWPETYVQPQVLRTYMLELRKLLGDDAGQPRFIQTLPKRGYCFVAAVSEPDGGGRDAAAGGTGSATESRRLVGRDEELRGLRTKAKLAESGQRQAVFVTGEAGIGKSALVDAFCHGLGAGWSVARGQCVEGFGGKEEYYPVMDALGQLCGSADAEMACGILARMAPAWLAALSRPSEDSVAAAAVPVKERKPGDLCGALEQIAEKKPLVVVFEDLHWADDATLNLISALARRRAAARLMVVATCGPGDGAMRGRGQHPLKGLKQNLLMRQLCSEATLPPLTKTAVGELLCRELEQETPPAGLTGFVHQHSEGNPLFAIAIVEHLIARRFLVREGTNGTAQWRAAGAFEEMEGEVPERLAQMIELEIEGLSAEEQRILGAGSTVGIAFPVWAVAAALGEDAAGIEEACAGLARRLHFVERGGQDELPNGTRSEFYVFVHGLYREVLYRRQAGTRRAIWHVRIAEGLDAMFAERAWAVARETATHYGAAGEWQRAANALRAAAGHARERQAHGEATQLLEDALRMGENLAEKEREKWVVEIRRELASAAEAGSGGRPRIASKKA